MNAECKIVKAETKDGFVATYHLMQNGRKIGVEINISSPILSAQVERGNGRRICLIREEGHANPRHVPF
ncbi:hypothetical protein [Alistipes sp.]|jgi:hypothetical protein|uniref:hypothetical protein n=1 Tax=Alistipes sp. TaxID=1872444 RepID=UPI0020632BBC|nr:hypothetical protein [Alistipes sp.]MBS7026506.1 hypothetical protein [Alistipes sp.]DAG12654.1 MAG TPA: hypothetical protein [Caudoviricetes sp.]DAL88731.1 MAG TPA: hypothetical protein [Caudoviricetes sp.]